MSLKIKTRFEFDDALKSIEQLRKALESAVDSFDGKPVTKEMNDAIKSINQFLAKTENLGSTIDQTYKSIEEHYKAIEQHKEESARLSKEQAQHEEKLAKYTAEKAKIDEKIEAKKNEYLSQGKSLQRADTLARQYREEGSTRSIGIQSASLGNKAVDEKNAIAEINNEIARLNENIAESETAIETCNHNLAQYSEYLDTAPQQMKQVETSWDGIVERNIEATQALKEQERLEQEKARLAQEAAQSQSSDTQVVEEQVSDWRRLQQQIEANAEEINAYERALEILRETGHSALDEGPVIEHLTALQEENAELAKMQDSIADINISSMFDRGDISGTADRLRDYIQNIFDSVEGVDLSPQLQTMIDKLSALSVQAERTKEEMDVLADRGMGDSLEYQNAEDRAIRINNQMRIYIEKWNEAIAKMREANATPTPAPGGQGGEGVNPVENAQNLRDEYTAANRALMSLTTSTRSLGLLLPGVSTRGVRGITMLTRAMLRLSTLSKEQMITAIKTIGKAVSTVLSTIMKHPIVLAIAALIAALAALVKAVKKTKEEVEAMGKAFLKGFTSASKAIGKFTLSMGKGFLALGTNVMKSVLDGLKAIVDKIKSLKSVITENLKLMAKWNNGNNAVNKAMTNLTSSLAYLKAAFTSAFVPILTVVEPIITRLVDKLAELATMIGMFVAKLSGAATFQKAIKVQKDYAKALDKTGSSAKKTLASFDELNILNGDKGGGGEAVDWEEVEMAKVEIPDLISKLRELGNEVGTKIRDTLNSIPWDKVKDGAEYAAKAVSAFINALFDVTGLGKAVGNAIAEIGNAFVIFVNGLLTGIDFGRIGEQLGQMAQKFLDTFDFKKFGQIWSNSLNALATLLYNFFANMNGEDLGKGLTDWFQNAFGRIDWTTIRGTIILGVQDIVGALNEIFTPENFSLLGKSIANLFNSVVLAVQEFATGADWEKWGKSISKGINDLFKSFNPKQAGKAISDLAHGLLDMLLTAINEIDWDEVSTAIVDFVSNIDWAGLGAKAKEISTKLMDALQQIWAALEESGAFDDIIELIVDVMKEKKNWEKAFKKIRNEMIREVIVEKITNALQNIQDAIIEAIFPKDGADAVGTDASNYGEYIISGLVQGIFQGVGLMGAEPFQVIFDWIWDGICQIFGIHSPATTMNPVGENIVNGILEGFSLVDVGKALSDWWDKNIAPWFTLEKWKGIGETVRVALTTKMDEIKTNLTTKWENLTTTLTEKIDILKEIFSLKFDAIKNKVVDTFTAIKEGIKTPINGIISIVESMINFIINGINGLVDKMNSFDFDMTNPITGKSYTFDVNIPKLSTVSIPRLAQGAVLPPNSPFLAMLGDQNRGTNIEAPLETIKQALAETMQNLNFGGGEQQINVYLGTDLIYSEIKKLERRNAVIGG